MRALVFLTLGLALACDAPVKRGPGPLGDAKIVNVEPAQAWVGDLIETVCIESDDAIFQEGRTMTCVLDGEPRGPLARESDTRACCDALYDVGTERGSIDVGVVLFEDGEAKADIEDENAIQVRALPFDLQGLLGSGPAGVDFGVVNEWLIGLDCPMNPAWLITGREREPLVLDIEGLGMDLSFGDPPFLFEPLCADGVELASGATCMLAACVTPVALGPLEMSITVRARDFERRLEITGEVRAAPLVDASFGAHGALIVGGDRNAGDITTLMPPLAVTSSGGAYAAITRELGAQTGLLVVDPDAGIASNTEIAGLAFDSSITITAADRLFVARYDAIGLEVLAVDAANPAGDPAYQTTTSVWPQRIAADPATGALWVASGGQIARLDSIGATVAGFPRSTYASLNGSELLALAVEATGAAVVFETMDADGDGFWNNPFAVRILPDGTRDDTFGVEGLLMLDDPAVFFDAAAAPEPPIDEGMRIVDAAVDADGTIVFVAFRPGTSVNPLIVVRLDPSGARVAGFGEGGVARLAPFAGRAQAPTRLAIAPDGALFVSGVAFGTTAVPFIVEITAEGALVDGPPLTGKAPAMRAAWASVVCGATACFAAGTATDAHDFLARLE